MVIEATRMPFDTAKLHFAKAALYQEYELEGENIILPLTPLLCKERKKIAKLWSQKCPSR